MAKTKKLTGALWGLLCNTRGISVPPLRNTPPFTHQQRTFSAQLQSFQFSALGKEAKRWLMARRASNVASNASIPLFQTSIGKTEAVAHLVQKGMKAQKQVGLWLFGCSAWVFSMVLIGGVTRLTKSGLSMTDWKFLGSFPPMSSSEWQAEFQKYKNSPEYKRTKGQLAQDIGNSAGAVGSQKQRKTSEKPVITEAGYALFWPVLSGFLTRTVLG
ncbi:hypothetical protein L7F22_009013 [Adiantum nelumboides]|nr:hypothetical protein [Adiantum nelumboides]